MQLQILPHLVGQKGKTKLKVEQDTGATISVPRKNSTALPGSREADVIVRASTTSAAVSAATRLELLVENMLNSNKCAACFGVVGGCTYQSPLIELFIGHAADWDTLTLSLSRSLTQAAFEHFKTSVTQDPRAATAQIEESIFVATKQIHLTVTMLKLYSEQKRHLAKQVSYQQETGPSAMCCTAYVLSPWPCLEVSTEKTDEPRTGLQQNAFCPDADTAKPSANSEKHAAAAASSDSSQRA